MSEENVEQVVDAENAGNGVAVGALVCGITGTVFGITVVLGSAALALGLAALALGILGWRRVTQNPAAGRKGVAIAGMILGIVAIGLGAVGVVIDEDVTHCINHPNARDCR